MGEGAPKPGAEDKAERPLPTQAEMALYENWLEDFPPPTSPQESPEMCAEKIHRFEEAMDGFGQRHDIEALRAITHFNSREERLGSFRQVASAELTPLV